MKLLAIVMMLFALYLLYRIAFPKQAGTTKDDNVPEKEEKHANSVMGKSRFVLPDRSKPLQTTATQTDIEKYEEKSYSFAAESEEQQSVEIPADELDEAFGDGNPEIMSIPLDTLSNEVENDGNIDIEAEEEFEEAVGQEAMYADGYDFEDLQTVAQVVREQPETVDEQTGKTLVALEHTELLTLLAEGKDGIMNWIKTVIDRHVQNTMPATEAKVSTTTDYGDFEIVDFFS